MIEIAKSFTEVARPYSVLFCDVWGVIHNGVAPFPLAVAALEGARASGKFVVLVSNSPRPGSAIPAQLRQIGVSNNAYDLIVTSGDATRVRLGDWSARGRLQLHHIGPSRDLPLFEGLAIDLVPLAQATHVVCTGPFDDETETPADYAETLAEIARRQMPFLCANPDIVVQRGDRLIYCAGALAQALEAFGGEATYVGKPHLPIYNLCAERVAERLGRAPPKSEILAIGDALKTDLLGAQRFGVASLLIADGIHAADFVRDGEVDRKAVEAACREANVHPTAAMVRLSP